MRDHIKKIKGCTKRKSYMSSKQDSSPVIPDLFCKEIRSGDKWSTFLELYLKLPSNLDHNQVSTPV